MRRLSQWHSVASALTAVAVATWFAAAAWLAVTDLRTRLLPTRWIWPTAAVVWVLYASAAIIDAEPGGLIGSAIGAAVCGGALAAVHFAHPPSMGFGDVRLSVLNGLVCGWWGWQIALAGLAAAFLLALPEALVTMAKQGLRASRPLGPYLVAGSGVALVWAAATAGLVPVR